MVTAARSLSVREEQKRQRRERLFWTVGLIICAAIFAALLVLAPGIAGPLPLAIGLVALPLAVAISLNARIGLYVLLFCAVFLEQWGIAGLDPVTGRFPFYQTLAGAGSLPLSVSPVEMVILLSLAAMALPLMVRRSENFLRGPLFAPLTLFLLFVMGSIAYGIVGGQGAGPFDVKAAWAETRSLFYLGATYVLACNLIKTRAQLRTFIWFFIIAVGFKGLQGIVRYVDVRANGLQVEAITGHEDVVFFAAFILLLATLLLFRAGLEGPVRRQVRVMLIFLPPLLVTLLVTDRRLGFVVLAAGLGLIALLLLRTRRDLFLRVTPVVAVVLALYTVIFWNATGTLGTPIRAVRSLVAPATQRDLLSNRWRELENINIDYNIRSAPLMGSGFGRPYTFIVSQPPLDETGFTYWRYITHNAIYWVWMKMGLAGFILFWNLIGSAIILGIVAFRRLGDGYVRALALVVAAVVLMQVIFSYGDLGLTYSRSMIFLGGMLGMLARLPALRAEEEEESGALAAETWATGAEPAALPGTPG